MLLARNLLFGAAQRRFFAMKIYTRTGDKGRSSLYTGERRRKDDAVFKTLGDVDELNSNVGLARAHLTLLQRHAETDTLQGLSDRLAEVQSRLIDVGSAVATPSTTNERKRANVAFDADSIARLEHDIDQWDQVLPPLKEFILPSGGVTAAQLHVCRTVCRRAERRAVSLFVRDDSGVDTNENTASDTESDTESEIESDQTCENAALVTRYLNRLSDWLFMAARVAAKFDDGKETTYKRATSTHTTRDM
ncbi:MAG: hypothetical protein MHM6MM_002046 [Cercozoa sp. M6MM]